MNEPTRTTQYVHTHVRVSEGSLSTIPTALRVRQTARGVAAARGSTRVRDGPAMLALSSPALPGSPIARCWDCPEERRARSNLQDFLRSQRPSGCKQQLPWFYWQASCAAPYNCSNFGDELNVDLGAGLLGLKRPVTEGRLKGAHYLSKREWPAKKGTLRTISLAWWSGGKVVAIGSVGAAIRRGDVVAGPGVYNLQPGNLTDSSAAGTALRLGQIHLSALRGPISCEELLRVGANDVCYRSDRDGLITTATRPLAAGRNESMNATKRVDAPLLLVDPGLITPAIAWPNLSTPIPPSQLPDARSSSFQHSPACVMAHARDATLLSYLLRQGEFNTTRQLFHNMAPQRLARVILGCGRVISSGLHGLILADALGVPTVWWHGSGTNQGAQKFNDYMLAVGRPANQYVLTLLEAHTAAPLTPLGFQFVVDTARTWIERFPWARVCSANSTGK